MDMLKIGGAVMAAGTAAAMATGMTKMKSNPKKTMKKLAKKSAKYIKKHYLSAVIKCFKGKGHCENAIFAPDVMINLRIAGFLCGLGEIGYSKMLLTPEFGPRQRVGIIITDLELEPDPIIEPGTLCNRCMACVRECPGQCIPADRTIKANVGGYELEWADVDMTRCDWTFQGGEECKEGEYGNYFDHVWSPGWKGKFKASSISPFPKAPNPLYNSGKAVCGAKGCTRACMISLEKRGVFALRRYAQKYLYSIPRCFRSRFFV